MSNTAEVKAGGMNASLRVIIIDDESSNIGKVLGISDEREDQLQDIVKAAFEGDDTTITDNLAEISKHCKHANELAFCSFHLGAHIGKGKALEVLMKDNGPMGGLLSALKELRSGSGKSNIEPENPTDSND